MLNVHGHLALRRLDFGRLRRGSSPANPSFSSPTASATIVASSTVPPDSTQARNAAWAAPVIAATTTAGRRSRDRVEPGVPGDHRHQLVGAVGVEPDVTGDVLASVGQQLPHEHDPLPVLGPHRRRGEERLTQRRDGAFVGRPGRQRPDQPVDEAALVGPHDVRLGREVAEERARRDAGGVGDLVHRHLAEAACGEQVDRHALDLVGGERSSALPEVDRVRMPYVRSPRAMRAASRMMSRDMSVNWPPVGSPCVTALA